MMSIRENGENNPGNVLFAGKANGSPSDCDWGILETMGPIVRRGSIFKTMRKLMVMRNCKTKRMLRSSKYLPKIEYCAIAKVESSETLNIPKAKFRGYQIDRLF